MKDLHYTKNDEIVVMRLDDGRDECVCHDFNATVDEVLIEELI